MIFVFLMKDFDDAMLDVAQNNLESETNRFNDIDTKAIGVITISGILMAVLPKPSNAGVLTIFLFTMASLCFLAVVAFSILTIRVRSGVKLSTNCLIEDLKSAEPPRQIRGIIGTIAEAERKIGDACDSKLSELRWATYFLGVGVAFLILYYISSIF